MVDCFKPRTILSTPLNIWKCESCGYQEAIGSRQELIQRANQQIDQIELHRPYVDAITLTCSQCGGDERRTLEVLDCWFDSGAMFVAQNHYPLKIKNVLPAFFQLILFAKLSIKPGAGFIAFMF